MTTMRSLGLIIVTVCHVPPALGGDQWSDWMATSWPVAEPCGRYDSIHLDLENAIDALVVEWSSGKSDALRFEIPAPTPDPSRDGWFLPTPAFVDLNTSFARSELTRVRFTPREEANALKIEIKCTSPTQYGAIQWRCMYGACRPETTHRAPNPPRLRCSEKWWPEKRPSARLLSLLDEQADDQLTLVELSRDMLSHADAFLRWACEGQRCSSVVVGAQRQLQLFSAASKLVVERVGLEGRRPQLLLSVRVDQKPERASIQCKWDYVPHVGMAFSCSLELGEPGAGRIVFDPDDDLGVVTVGEYQWMWNDYAGGMWGSFGNLSAGSLLHLEGAALAIVGQQSGTGPRQ